MSQIDNVRLFKYESEFSVNLWSEICKYQDCLLKKFGIQSLLFISK